MSKQNETVVCLQRNGSANGERIGLACNKLVPKQGQSLGVISPKLQLLMLNFFSSELGQTPPLQPAGITNKY